MSSRYTPSVTDEKGAYRMRAPRSTRPAFSDTLRDTNTGPPTQDRKTAAIIAVLVIAACSSFGTAYYLYTTR